MSDKKSIVAIVPHGQVAGLFGQFLAQPGGGKAAKAKQAGGHASARDNRRRGHAPRAPSGPSPSPRRRTLSQDLVSL